MPALGSGVVALSVTYCFGYKSETFAKKYEFFLLEDRNCIYFVHVCSFHSLTQSLSQPGLQ